MSDSLFQLVLTNYKRSFFKKSIMSDLLGQLNENDAEEGKLYIVCLRIEVGFGMIV
jgi:hypothetical protein